MKTSAKHFGLAVWP